MPTPLRSEEEAGSLLETYLLQGWVMTNQICSVEGCSYPLMRSKDGSTSFCTHHDPLPNAPSKRSTLGLIQESTIEVDELALQRQRREQSSKASQLIGQKMLQKWALLNENCPNDTCYAIPLIRHPTSKQMYCVICEKFIMTKEDTQTISTAVETKRQVVQEKQQEFDKTAEKKEQEMTIERKEQERTIERKEQGTIKRQKITSQSDLFSSQVVLSNLSAKMNDLNERIKVSDDPVELSQLFKCIKSCANAIKACAEAGRVYDKNL
ncbi:hypothetical protein G6F62_003039 [Rhizopus arrhizus]|nr:hypothetical protein G6F62_003039 [Rhizopus arrhizus]